MTRNEKQRRRRNEEGDTTQKRPTRPRRISFYQAKTRTKPLAILPCTDGRGREAFKVLQRPMAIKVSVVNTSQKERRAADKQRRRNEEKKKEAEKREQRRPKLSESRNLVLLRGKCSKNTESLIFPSEHEQTKKTRKNIEK